MYICPWENSQDCLSPHLGTSSSPISPSHMEASSSNSFSESPHHTMLSGEKGPAGPGGLIGSGAKERSAGETGQDSLNEGAFQNPWNTPTVLALGDKAVKSTEESVSVISGKTLRHQLSQCWNASPLQGRDWSGDLSPASWPHYYPPDPSAPAVKVKVNSLSRVQIFATPWTVDYNAPLSMGFSSQEYWSGLPFPSSLFIIPQVTSVQHCPEAGLNAQGFLYFSLTLKTMQDHHSNVRLVVCRFLYMVKSWKKFRVPWRKCFISQKMKKYIK